MNKIAVLIILILITSCGDKIGRTEKESMNLVRNEVKSSGYVELPANMVWGKLVAFDGTEKFVPELIKKVDVIGEGVGAVRNIYLNNGGEIVEKLTKIEAEKYLMEFKIVSTPMPVFEYKGVLKVHQISNEECEVIFISKYNVLPENKDEMRIMIKKFQEIFISNLDR